MTTQTMAVSPATSDSGVSSPRLTTALLMIFAGAALIFIVGFAQGSGEFLHNAAHDTRHTFTFPCH